MMPGYRERYQAYYQKDLSVRDGQRASRGQCADHVGEHVRGMRMFAPHVEKAIGTMMGGPTNYEVNQKFSC